MEKIVEATILEDGINEQKVPVDSDMLVEMENVSKIFDKTTWAVKKINLQIKRGECIALIGANGAGKSTVGRLIANVIKQTSGIIDYYFKQENIFKSIGYQSREQSWPNGFTVKDITTLWINIYNVQDKEWIARLKDVFGVDNIWERNLSKLSIVPLQLFATFLACLYKPELLVIDDLSSSIDFERKDKIVQLFKEYVEEGNTIVLVYPDDFIMNNLTNRIVFINGGEITDDLSVEEVNEKYGSIFEYIKGAVKDEAAAARKKKADPFFKPIIENFDTLYNSLTEDYSTYFENQLDSQYVQFDLDIKNTIFYVTELKEQLHQISISNLIKSNVDKVRKSIKKNKTSLKKILKSISKLKNEDAPIKHISKLERDFFRINQFVSGKLSDVFKDDKLIINGDTMEIELPKDEKRQLKALKERYIKEELKIIRLERRRLQQHDLKNIPRRLMKNLTPKEKEVVDKAIGANTDTVVEGDGQHKIVALINGKVVLKNENQINDKTIVLFDGKKNSKINENFFEDSEDDATMTHSVYYDSTVELSASNSIRRKNKFNSNLLKSKKMKEVK